MADYSAAVADSRRGTLLRVRVTPRARATCLDGLHGNAARLRVAAPPADGKANAALLGFLASALGVRPRDLSIVQGRTGRDKTLLVPGMEAGAVAARLGSA